MEQKQGTMEDMGIEKDFWCGRRVFLTGHTGFKGSWMSIWLKVMGAKVTGYSLSPTGDENLYKLANIAECVDSNFADIRDLEKLKAAMVTAQPEVVIHMAAQSLVRDSYNDPIGTYATNVMGTANVLEVARKIESIRVVLNITSDKCYENKEWERGYREGDPMGGYDPYSSSKGCSELVSSAYFRSFLNEKNIGLGTARAGNVIGGGDWAKDRIVPDAIRAFVQKETLKIRNPMATRPWQHVLEPLSGYLLLCQNLYKDPKQYSSAWNFGPESVDIQPVSRLADGLVRNWNNDVAWQLDQGEHPHEARLLNLDCTKAQAGLGWRPIWRFERAIKETTDWYKAWYDKKDMQKFTIEQIMNYTNALQVQ